MTSSSDRLGTQEDQKAMEKTIHRIVSWKVEIVTGSDWATQVAYYATESLAREVVEKAYQDRLKEIPTLPGFDQMAEACPIGEGSANPWGRKIVWWKRVIGGVIAVKEYFDAQEEVIAREILSV
jgi:hypothetical protein